MANRRKQHKRGFTVSIVSHNQISMVSRLLSDLEKFSDLVDEIVLTINCPEKFDISKYKNKISVIMNREPKGFGANHNAAFKKCSSEYFFVLNPDIRAQNCDFQLLMEKFDGEGIGIVSPCIVNENGDPEDHARPFPTILGLFARHLLPKKDNDHGSIDTDSFDWVGGMFLAFKSETFRLIGGFDERYFMYCEDIDICRTATSFGLEVCLEERAKAVHTAQRASRRSLRMFLIHLSSVIKYFRKWEWSS